MAGDPAKASSLWLVLHGYGQLAGGFLAELEGLHAPHRLVAAPEGLSRFYARGMTGAVGASWMTRDDRESDIRDNMVWLDAVAEDVIRSMAPPRNRVVMGFSQGAATAARWAAHTRHAPDHLVIWCSDVPKDISDEALALLSRRTLTWYVSASDDGYMDDVRIRGEIRYLEAKGVRHRTLRFDGKHEVDAGALGRLLASLPPGC